VAVQSLHEVGDALRKKLKTEISFKLVRTRVFLRTGIDLGEVSREQDGDRALVSKVLLALSECGHNLS
jgi:hypothetical protein